MKLFFLPFFMSLMSILSTVYAVPATSSLELNGTTSASGVALKELASEPETHKQNYAFRHFRVTYNKVEADAFHDFVAKQACLREFGQDYRAASWEDLQAFFASASEAEKNAFFDKLGISVYDPKIKANEGDEKPRYGYLISKGGTEIWMGQRHFAFDRHDGNKPKGYKAHDQIENFRISLGSWWTTNYALCYQEDSTDDADSTTPAK